MGFSPTWRVGPPSKCWLSVAHWSLVFFFQLALRTRLDSPSSVARVVADHRRIRNQMASKTFRTISVDTVHRCSVLSTFSVCFAIHFTNICPATSMEPVAMDHRSHSADDRTTPLAIFCDFWITDRIIWRAQRHGFVDDRTSTAGVAD